VVHLPFQLRRDLVGVEDMTTPGPGYYNGVGERVRRNLTERKPLRFLCCLNGGDSCNGCGIIFTTQDYYKCNRDTELLCSIKKNTFRWLTLTSLLLCNGRKNWCLACFKRKCVDTTGKTFAAKVRSCSFHHVHNTPGCTMHTTTADQIRKLTRLEKIMWLKYGDTI
ncbi:unnamed protein product, partial [Allacma fusca]